jgi:hypothetical protein
MDFNKQDKSVSFFNGSERDTIVTGFGIKIYVCVLQCRMSTKLHCFWIRNIE